MEDFKWIFQFLGRLHPLIVHFPIGLLVVGFVLELFTIGQRRQGLRQGINLMIFIGAIMAIISALLGWLLRINDDYVGELVDFHQKMGNSYRCTCRHNSAFVMAKNTFRCWELYTL